MIDFVTNIIGVRVLLITAGVLLIINIALGVTVKIQGAQLDAAKAETQTRTTQLQACGDQEKAQNAAVDQMLAIAAAAADKLHAAEAEAGKIRVVTETRIQYVQLASIPVTCPEAVSWGASHAIAIGKRWETTP